MCKFNLEQSCWPVWQEDNHFTPKLSLRWSTHLFHSKQLDDIAVVEFPQHLKLPHLDLMGAVIAHHVKHLDSYQLARFLHAPHARAHT